MSRCVFSAITVAIGVVSVIPHASMKRMSYFCSYHSTNWRGSAEPAQTMERRLEISRLVCSRKLYSPIHKVGTPAVKVARSDSIILAMSAGCRNRPLKTILAPTITYRIRDAPTVGVKHRHQLQDSVALAQREYVGETQRIAVKHQRPMTEQHAFGMAGGAGGIADRRRFLLIEIGPAIRLVPARRPAFVHRRCRRRRCRPARRSRVLRGSPREWDRAGIVASHQ